jgi:DNA repair exonuclease SbcCD ATPase subunit
MRRDLLCAAVAAFLLIPASALAQQPGQSQNQEQQGQSSSQTAAPPSSQSATPAQATPVDPLVAAARKAREQKKDQPKPARVFDNDNIPTQGGVSAVGSSPAGESTENGGTAESGGEQAAAKTTAPPSGNDEKTWRERFAKLHKKLERDQADLDIMQRELGVLDVQYYNDPMKGMQQGYTRSDINEKTAKIDEKKKQVEADQQALSDAEDELRRSGGDIGWAR